MHKVCTIKRSLILFLSAASLSLTACGNLPTAATSAISGVSGNALSVLSTDTTSTASNSPVGRQGKGGHGGEHGDRKGPGGPGGPGTFVEFGLGGPQMTALNLTDAQKTQIQALQTEAKAFFEANKPAAPSTPPAQSDLAAARTAFEAAFKSDAFDPATLTANKPVRPTPTDAQIDFQVDQMIKLHDILTAEQRAIVAKGPDQANRPSAPPSPPADAVSRDAQRLDKLAADLTLTDDQKTQLKALFDAENASRQTEMENHKNQLDSERTAMTTLLTAETVDRAALKALIQARSTKAPEVDNHLQQLVKIHDILTADQRAKFLTLNQVGPGGHEGPAGFAGMNPQGPGGPGGHRGPGMEQLIPGL